MGGLDAFSIDGQTFALPLTMQGFVIYDNKTRYTEAGLDPNAPPQTYDDLIAACDAIIAAGAVPCFAMGNKEGFGGDCRTLGRWRNPWLVPRGGQIQGRICIRHAWRGGPYRGSAVGRGALKAV